LSVVKSGDNEGQESGPHFPYILAFWKNYLICVRRREVRKRLMGHQCIIETMLVLIWKEGFLDKYEEVEGWMDWYS